jgi:NTE family protein
VGNVGLVLTGGGARAAYQTGAISALAEIRGPGPSPFAIITGVSAGAVNGVSLAAGADDFPNAAGRLASLWRELQPDKVYRTDARKMLRVGGAWLRELAGGGVLGAREVNFLLDTTPLRDFLRAHLPIPRMRRHIRTGVLRGVAVSATNYADGTAVTFFDGAPAAEPWLRSTRIGVREHLKVEHVMASAAIPLIFPPVRIRGVFFGDGCVRLLSPLSPAIHLGAERLLAVGVRHRAPEARGPRRGAAALPLSRIAGLLLNAVFLDSLEEDVERLERMNRVLAVLGPAQRERLREPMRQIPILVLRPSRDLGGLAGDQYRRFPRFLRYLLRGIGGAAEEGSDLLSYLAFEPVYVGRCQELGYADTMLRRREIEAFLGGEPAAAGRRDAAGM